MVSVELTGFEILSGEERNIFDRLSEEYLRKIEMKIKNLSSVKIHLKDYSKEGKRNKYSLHAKLVVPGKPFEASAVEWDFAVALHKLFKKIEEGIVNRFRPEDKNKR